MRFFKPEPKLIKKEKVIPRIEFNVYKFNNRKKPINKNSILFITCFSEFGCESLALLYCIPKIIQSFPGAYVICVGWFGREFLYRHLADEYWEIKEDFQFLREFSRAFNPKSQNIANLENTLAREGRLYKSSWMGRICVGTSCEDCGNIWADSKKICEKCGSLNIVLPLFSDLKNSKKKAVKIPFPSKEAQAKISSFLEPNSVGIFARNRVSYGRNLKPEFYVKLISQLEERGYKPIWLGEKQSVMPCPVSHILDFSRMPQSRDLELTLSIISQLDFTFQAWTASTRLASMVNTPWILFESPEQIYGKIGQEGKRIYLTGDKKKLILAHFSKILENQDLALELFWKAVNEINSNNWDDILGPFEDVEFIENLIKNCDWRNSL